MDRAYFYFFCEHCGADTATYEKYRECPYCHTSGKRFRLISQTGLDGNEEVASVLEAERKKWQRQHHMPVGQKKRKRFSWKK